MIIYSTKNIETDEVEVEVDFGTDDERIKFDEAYSAIIAIADHYNSVTKSFTGGTQMLSAAIDFINKSNKNA